MCDDDGVDGDDGDGDDGDDDSSCFSFICSLMIDGSQKHNRTEQRNENGKESKLRGEKKEWKSGHLNRRKNRRELEWNEC